METEINSKKGTLPHGVMLNAYPDSIGRKLADTVRLLKRPEFKDVFSMFYILPSLIVLGLCPRMVRSLGVSTWVVQVFFH